MTSMTRRNPSGFYMNRKPQTRPFPESKKPPLPEVPLTQRAIDQYGSLSMAQKAVERLLGYKVKINVVQDLTEEQLIELKQNRAALD